MAFFVLGGCSSPEPEHPSVQVWERPCDLEPGFFEVEETAQAFKNKLASFTFPERVLARSLDGKPVIQLLTIRNESDDHFDVNVLTDKLREVVTDSQKAVFMSETGRLIEIDRALRYQRDSGDVRKDQQVPEGRGLAAQYALLGRLKNIRKRSGGVTENTIIFTLELDDLETRTAVLLSAKEFRLSKM